MRSTDQPESPGKSAYRRLCTAEASIPIFSRDWWLDAVCEDGDWDVAVVEKDGAINGAIPYRITNHGGLTLINHPPLTQTLGPWLRLTKSKYGARLAQQKDIMLSLINALPSFDHFSQNWHYSQANWLPFYWRDFTQTTRYTYVLPDLSNIDQLWSNLRENIRGDVRKASNRFGIRIADDVDVSEFIELNEQIFRRQGMKRPYSESVIRRLDRACAARHCRKIFIALDPNGVIHAGVYIVWDDQRAYYLMGGSNTEFRNSGAGSLCLWSAIKHASTVVRSFDFEGSMLENVERYFRAFGAIQMPYFVVSKTPSRRVRARQALSMFIKG